MLNSILADEAAGAGYAAETSAFWTINHELRDSYVAPEGGVPRDLHSCHWLYSCPSQPLSAELLHTFDTLISRHLNFSACQLLSVTLLTVGYSWLPDLRLFLLSSSRVIQYQTKDFFSRCYSATGLETWRMTRDFLTTADLPHSRNLVGILTPCPKSYWNPGFKAY